MQSISDVKWMLLQRGGRKWTHRADSHTVSAIGRVGVWINKTLRGWWMRTDGETVDLFSDTWMCARRPGDYMSRLQGLSELTSPNEELQTEFAASKCEDMKPGGWTRIYLLFYLTFLPGLSFFISTQQDTHAHSPPTTSPGVMLRVPDSHINNL